MSVIEMYREGDVVRLTKGDMVVQAPVIDNGIDYPYLALTGYEKYLELRNIIAEGWSIDIIKRAADKVPTEPGIYRDAEDDFWVLKDDGKWTLYSVSVQDGQPYANDGYFPLVRLEEVK